MRLQLGTTTATIWALAIVCAEACFACGSSDDSSGGTGGTVPTSTNGTGGHESSVGGSNGGRGGGSGLVGRGGTMVSGGNPPSSSNPAGCPGSEPVSGTGCTNGLNCMYGPNTWSCLTDVWSLDVWDGSTSGVCPTPQPKQGDTCVDSLKGSFCQYSSSSCSCVKDPANPYDGQDGLWSCLCRSRHWRRAGNTMLAVSRRRTPEHARLGRTNTIASDWTVIDEVPRSTWTSAPFRSKWR